MENVINTLHLSGKVVGTPVIGHEAFGEKFYYLTLGVPRLSGEAECRRQDCSDRKASISCISEADAGWNGRGKDGV